MPADCADLNTVLSIVAVVGDLTLISNAIQFIRIHFPVFAGGVAGFFLARQIQPCFFRSLVGGGFAVFLWVLESNICWIAADLGYMQLDFRNVDCQMARQGRRGKTEAIAGCGDNCESVAPRLF